MESSRVLTRGLRASLRGPLRWTVPPRWPFEMSVAGLAAEVAAPGPCLLRCRWGRHGRRREPGEEIHGSSIEAVRSGRHGVLCSCLDLRAGGRGHSEQKISSRCG
jgi:hypothetical protein